MLKKILGFILFCSSVAYSQQYGATIPAGIGDPRALATPLVCTKDMASSVSTSLYDDRSITVGNSIWKCKLGTDGSTYAWQAPFLSPVLGVSTTAQFASQSFLLSGCTTTLSVTISGATVGTNAATASPIFVSAPTAGTNVALLNVVAWVSSANTVSVQGCASGILGTIPAFTAKVLLY